MCVCTQEVFKKQVYYLYLYLTKRPCIVTTHILPLPQRLKGFPLLSLIQIYRVILPIRLQRIVCHTLIYDLIVIIIPVRLHDLKMVVCNF